MADQTGQSSAYSGRLKDPFAEQVAFWRSKLGNLVPTERWDDMLGTAHDDAWMVAGAQDADLLTDLAASIDRAITDGRTLDDYRRDFAAIVERRGWTGWTGEGTAEGEAWRTRITYTTNTRVSYAAGREAQLQAGGYAIRVYKHSRLSADPRPEHLAWDGLTLPADHPFWAAHSPPNGYGCQCYQLGARNDNGARRLGGDPNKRLPDGWDQRDAKGRLPGIGEGWDYAPGVSVAHLVQTMAEKAAGWPQDLARAYMADLPTGRRDALATAYRNLPTVARDTRLYAQRIQDGRTYLDIPASHTLGLLTDAQRVRVAELLGADVGLADWAIERASVDALSDALAAADYRRLPALLNGGARIEAGSAAGRVRLVGADGLHTEWELRQGRMVLVSAG